MVTATELREILDYDPETGTFKWKVSKRRGYKGKEAGCIGKRGYIYIGIDGKIYSAHRLAWLYMTGKEPPPQIDHHDGDTGNNAWSNLRKASPSQNRANAKVNSNSETQLKGVYHYKRYGKFGARVKKDGRKIWLGWYETAEAAHAAYCAGARTAHGRFARAE